MLVKSPFSTLTNLWKAPVGSQCKYSSPAKIIHCYISNLCGEYILHTPIMHLPCGWHIRISHTVNGNKTSIIHVSSWVNLRFITSVILWAGHNVGSNFQNNILSRLWPNLKSYIKSWILHKQVDSYNDILKQNKWNHTYSWYFGAHTIAIASGSMAW